MGDGASGIATLFHKCAQLDRFSNPAKMVLIQSHVNLSITAFEETLVLRKVLVLRDNWIHLRQGPKHEEARKNVLQIVLQKSSVFAISILLPLLLPLLIDGSSVVRLSICIRSTTQKGLLCQTSRMD